MSNEFKYWKDIGMDSEKKKFTEEVLTDAFKDNNNYMNICNYITSKFKEHYNEHWTVFGYNIGHGSGYSDYKDTFIGVEYKDFKITLCNHD